MPRTRSLLLARNGAFAVAALALSGVFVLAMPLVLVPTRIGWPVLKAYLHGIAFLLKWICGLTYEVRGIERLRPGPVLIASAHQTTWENLYLPILLDDPTMLVKEELLDYPLVGAIARKKGYIPAHRSGDIDKIRESVVEAKRQSDAGRNVLIFPSGTRTGTELDPPMRRGVAALYEKLARPCVPVALNSGLCWQNGSWLRHPGTIVVDILEPIPAGIEKKLFLDTLSTRLNTATTRLMHRAVTPVLMPNLSAAARRMATTMKSGRKAERG